MPCFCANCLNSRLGNTDYSLRGPIFASDAFHLFRLGVCFMDLDSMAGDAICDWLDVTYSPTDCPYPDLNLLLADLGFTATRDRSGGVTYAPPTGRGSIYVLHSFRFAKISLSGGACSYLRFINQFEPVLGVLSLSPHKVTRIDTAMDYPVDAADVIQHLLRRYPLGGSEFDA